MAAALLVAFVAIVSVTTRATYAEADHEPVWQSADSLRSLLFDAQQRLYAAPVADDPQAPQREAAALIEEARQLYAEKLQERVQTHNQQHDKAITAALDAAYEAARTGEAVRLGAARGDAWSALLHAAHDLTLDSLGEGDTNEAEEWLRLREFRQATRVNVVDNPAAHAIGAFAEGSAGLDVTLLTVSDDLRDAYFFRMRDALSEYENAVAESYDIRAAEWAALARGYYRILSSDYEAKLGSQQDATMQMAFDSLVAAAVRSEDGAQYLEAIRGGLAGYEPVELSPQDVAQRSQLLYLFIDLVYIEYRDGVRNGEITIEIEYLEAQTFRDQAQVTFEELRPRIAASDPAAAERLETLLSEMKVVIDGLEDKEILRTQTEEALALIQSTLDVETLSDDMTASFTVIAQLLDGMMEHVRQGDYQAAEQTRIQAYAIFDAGPEIRLLGLAPEIVAEIDGMFWQGYKGQPGLGQLLPGKATYDEVKEARRQLDAALTEGQNALSAGASPVAVITNAAVIVFREGLEAVIILAALLASMVKAEYRSYRRPLVAGSLLALVATGITWLLGQQVLRAFSQYGERLEAVVSLIAVGVLLLITNWFFHKVYWKDWMAAFHRMKGSLLRAETGQFVGLILLGFTSVYREGFETVLFLQALVLEAGSVVVLQGVLLGAAAVSIVGLLAFWMQRRLPYMQMLVITGVLIGVVLMIMVGKTVHIMQALLWIPVTPLSGVNLPYWMGLWLGAYPTWQTILAQLAAGAFVIGSYYVAEAQQKRELRAPQATPVTPSASQ